MNFDFYRSGYDDHHTDKRKKRGSLFFSRKKKVIKKSFEYFNLVTKLSIIISLLQDKSGKKIQHQWNTIIASSQANSICDSCMKSCANKHVLHCDRKLH